MTIPAFTQVSYPAGAPTCSRGRHGDIQTTGVEVYHNQHLVALSPINSRGQVSPACYLELPKDKQTLAALACHLLDIANSL